MNEENWTNKVTVYVCQAKIEAASDGLPLRVEDVERGVGADCIFHTTEREKMLRHLVEMHSQELLASFAGTKIFNL